MNEKDRAEMAIKYIVTLKELNIMNAYIKVKCGEEIASQFKFMFIDNIKKRELNGS